MGVFTIKHISSKVVAISSPLVVYGAGFNGDIKAWWGNAEGDILDFDNDSLTVSTPAYTGQFSLYFGTAKNKRKLVWTGFVVTLSETELDLPPALNNADFQGALLSLLPKGFSWFKGLTGNFAKLFSGFAKALVSINDVARLFRKESSASHTSSFSAWESELALPEYGIERDTDTGRRSEIFRKECRLGGFTIPYFKGLIGLYGIAAEIYEFWLNPEKFPDWVATLGDDSLMYWLIELPLADNEIHVMTCTDECTSALRWWSNHSIETLFEKIKPAHTKIVFTYRSIENTAQALIWAKTEIIANG